MKKSNTGLVFTLFAFAALAGLVALSVIATFASRGFQLDPEVPIALAMGLYGLGACGVLTVAAVKVQRLTHDALRWTRFGLFASVPMMLMLWLLAAFAMSSGLDMIAIMLSVWTSALASLGVVHTIRALRSDKLEVEGWENTEAEIEETVSVLPQVVLDAHNAEDEVEERSAAEEVSAQRS